MPKPKITDKNLYDLLGILSSATEQEIRSAYRKTALKCHPDKNPDDPKATETFRELSEAFEILVDPSAKAAYDGTLKAKEAAKLRTKEIDAKRRKLKEDLERREQEAKDRLSKNVDDSISSELKLQREIDRLRKEGHRKLIEEQEFIRQQILKEQKDRLSFVQSSVPKPGSALVSGSRLKLKWSSKLSFDHYKLLNICSVYGKVSDLVVLKKSALVEFESQEAADKFYKAESQKVNGGDYFKVEWISKVIASEIGEPKPSSANNSNSNSPKYPSSPYAVPPPQPTNQSFEEFEAMVLRNLKAAAERQKQQETNPKGTVTGTGSPNA